MPDTGNAVRYEPAVRRPRSAQTRARLLRSALTLFRERGYHGAGTNEIGAAAGMTGPSIYRHFATKDELLVESVLEAAKQLGDVAVGAHQEKDPLTALHMLCTSFVEVAVTDPDLLCVFFYESRHLPPEARTSLDQSANRYLRHYERLVTALRPELSAHEAPVRVRAASQMVGGMCTDLPEIPLQELKDILVKRMLVILLVDDEMERSA